MPWFAIVSHGLMLGPDSQVHAILYDLPVLSLVMEMKHVAALPPWSALLSMP